MPGRAPSRPARPNIRSGWRPWAAGSGPVARDGNGNRIGEFAYAILQEPKDFALIRLDSGVAASPQMCHFGGPTGTNSDTPGLTSPVSVPGRSRRRVRRVRPTPASRSVRR